MASFSKTWGVTLPFEQGGYTGYLKPSTSIDIDLDAPILPQLEKAIKIDGILNDLLVVVVDTQMARGQREYAPDDKSFESSVDHIPSQIDVSSALNMVREAMRNSGIK